MYKRVNYSQGGFYTQVIELTSNNNATKLILLKLYKLFNINNKYVHNVT